MPYTYKSTELTNIDALPPVRMAMNKESGPFKFFSYTVPAGTAATETVELVRWKKGQRLLGGLFTQDGLGNDIVLGDGTTANKYKASTSVASTGGFTFASTAAENYGEEATADMALIATITTGAWTAGKILEGHIVIGGGGI